jgi:hypothetical protein
VTLTRRSGLALALLGVTLLVFIVVASAYLPNGIDWHDTFRPAARELLALRSPYTVDGFYYPVWSLLPLALVAWLPENIGRALHLLMSLAGFGYVAYRLGAKPLALAAFLVSPPVLHCLLNSNIDWIPLLGVVLPPQAGLFLLVVKPQVGLVVGLFWLVEAWRKGRWREVLRVFWPVTVAMLATFAVFGLYPLRYAHTLSFWWNASLWPESIPVGLALLVASLRRRRMEYALAASPCLSPYVLFHSWSGALVALVASETEFLAAVAGLWVLVIVRALSGAA